MSAVTTNSAATAKQRVTWLPAAAVLLGTGWGAQQFTPMLLVYHRSLGVGTGTLEALFGVYALGLIPALLLAGPASDAHGRRSVVAPAAGLSLVSTAALIAGAHAVALLFVGRQLAGVSSGAVFSAGSAWVRELSANGVDDHAAARRVAIAMTAGFALGPLVAGLLAQWAPDSRVVAYLPHLALMTAALVALRATPETRAEATGRQSRLLFAAVRAPRFRALVAPMAPWVFTAPAIAFGLLPSIAGAGRARDGIALTAAVVALCALAGVAVQPLARRLDRHGNRAATTGLLVTVVGLAFAAVTAQAHETWMLVPSEVALGSAYGLCLVAGLTEVQRIAGGQALGALTAIYYTLCYLGFGVPYLLALGAHVTSYSILLTFAAVLAVASAAVVARAAGRAGGS